ncbi:Clp protease N-terminal domain-containing protein [Streptomyces sp. NPDC057137]|uniref:Clp protease N-terminal domain-containing protein n=1 Tax=Streptomyces sp. NPDC057137 TaxID=3346030 RepID=UPI0036316E59
MEQRQAADLTTVTTTEFGPDAVELLARTVRQAFRRTGPAIGTEHLLSTLLDDGEQPGETLVPGGIRETGSLGGEIRARGQEHWARDDSGPTAAADGGEAPDDAHHPDDVIEADAAWREALWVAGRASKALREEGTEPPRPTGALRATLLGALRLAREEGSPDAHARHLARALLLETPDSRALEALAIHRVDVTAAATALDAQAEAVRGGAEPWPTEAAAVTGSVKVLRTAGLLGERGVWWSRRMLSWMARGSGDRSPVLLVLSNEARRQAVRYGRPATEPVDLLLAVQALDRALTVAALALPDELLAVNSAADELRSAGVRQVDLVRAAAAAAGPAADSAVPGDLKRTPATDKLVAATRLLAAERKAETVGTVHVLAVLLDDPEGPASHLLRETGADLTALRTSLEATLATPAPAA